MHLLVKRVRGAFKILGLCCMFHAALLLKTFLVFVFGRICVSTVQCEMYVAISKGWQYL